MLEQLEVLKTGIQIAQQKGAYTLEASSALLTAYVKLKDQIENLSQSKELEKDPAIKMVKEKK